jgi:hypothetical protein
LALEFTHLHTKASACVSYKTANHSWWHPTCRARTHVQFPASPPLCSTRKQSQPTCHWWEAFYKSDWQYPNGRPMSCNPTGRNVPPSLTCPLRTTMACTQKSLINLLETCICCTHWKAWQIHIDSHDVTRKHWKWIIDLRRAAIDLLCTVYCRQYIEELLLNMYLVICTICRSGCRRCNEGVVYFQLWRKVIFYNSPNLECRVRTEHTSSVRHTVQRIF